MNAALTLDGFLGGRVKLWQPANGYRAGVDPVFLAAAVPARAGQSVLELGSGAGAAILCLAARVPDLSLTAVELQPEYAELAIRNARENGVALDVATADLRKLPIELRQRNFDQVLMNPPYYDRAASTAARDKGRDMALGGETPIKEWIGAATRLLAPKGYLTLIQRIDRLPEVFCALDKRLGSVVVRPLAAREGRAAGLFVLQARKGGRAAFHLAPPFIMHAGDKHLKDGEDYGPEARDILRFGAAFPLRD